MDGVKARLPEKLNPREPKAVVTGLGKELIRIHEVMSGTPLLEISDRLTLTSLSVFKTECLGALRVFDWGSFVVIVFKINGNGRSREKNMLDSLSDHGWNSSSETASPDFLYRYLSAPNDLAIASQIMLLLNSLTLPTTALKPGPCSGS
ncbi:MAG: hypothetical protein RL101_74 [Actinomycetota bacterium]